MDLKNIDWLDLGFCVVLYGPKKFSWFVNCEVWLLLIGAGLVFFVMCGSC